MSTASAIPPYAATIVPALQSIQHQYGYLNREALERYSEKSGVPRYRLHAIASFFPHFRLTPPKRLTLKVCRDQSCHLAGSGQILKDLAAIAGDDVAVEGVSCLGRCDR